MQGPTEAPVLVVSLDQVADRDVAAVGAKAANLARMRRHGLPVPPGFCVSAQAYREHLRAGGLIDLLARTLAECADASSPRRAELLAQVRSAIASVPLAPALAEQIAGHYRAMGGNCVAVRSSAIAEDLPGQSFAGQHDTYLGVTDLATCLRRVRDCWASLWSDRALEYRRQSGIGRADVDMAVIVQALVPAETAGVMFTADPLSGRRDCVIIEASFGLGEAVVAGKVAPDRIIVSKRVFRVERRVSGRKALEVVPDPSGGTREQAVDASRADRPCLDDATAGRLALLGARLEALFGAPQDVEWAVAEGDVHLLQSRPITALPPAAERRWEDRQIWTNVNLREVVPGVLTPTTYTFFRLAGLPLLDAFLGPVGIDVEPEDVAGLVAGRLYFNVNTAAALREVLPFGSRLDASILFGGGGAGADAPTEVRMPKEDLPTLHVRWHRKLTRMPDMLWRFLCSPTRRGRGILAHFGRCVTAMAREPWGTLDDTDLARRIRPASRFAKQDFLAGGATVAIVIAGIGYCLLLMALCRRWLNDENGNVAKRLLAGLGGMEDAEAGIALWRLAAMAHAAPQVEAPIREEKHFAGVARRLADTDGGKPFLAAWSHFMEAHGHHARGELELGNPRWHEQPDYVLGLVRSHLAGLGHVDPVAQARRLAQQRRRLARECLLGLRNPVKRLIFEAVLRRAQEGLRFRETTKSRAIRWIAVVRQMLLELGERLAHRGILGQRDDVFFLQMEELVPAAAGRFDPRPAIAERRAEYERNVALDPPAVVFGRFDPQQCAPEVVDDRVGVFRGMGVSPGAATGKARVILHAGQEHVAPGEVLVAPSTDPGWTPYFVNAAAIVMDQGGQLSHGSILAREYGIPCVVNVGPATKVIKTGRRIEVDGNRGIVRLLGGPSEKE
ncbi:MAG: PEP-utilizing enzyme [Planctomycetota bacterium]|nr:PEP-utilizing enzyme [Planctomycetota bacterium]